MPPPPLPRSFGSYRPPSPPLTFPPFPPSNNPRHPPTNFTHDLSAFQFPARPPSQPPNTIPPTPSTAMPRAFATAPPDGDPAPSLEATGWQAAGSGSSPGEVPSAQYEYVDDVELSPAEEGLLPGGLRVEEGWDDWEALLRGGGVAAA